jgi:hypothetical protein
LVNNQPIENKLIIFNSLLFKLIRHSSGKAILIVFTLLFFPVKVTFGQVGKTNDEDVMINCFFNKLYNFSFHEADSIVIVMSNSNFDKPTILNIKANLAWWKLLSGDSINQNLKTCNSYIDESILLLLKSKQQDFISHLNIIYAYSLKARIENYNGNTLRSLPHFYNSVIYMSKCLDNPVNDEKMDLVQGMYFYFLDYIKDEYFMMKVLFLTFPEGNKAKGLQYLEKCSNSDNELIRTEAYYLLFKIYSSIEKNYPKAYENVQVLTRQFPYNLVYSLEQLKLMLTMNKTSEAQIFQQKLLDEIRTSENINSMQKNHFITQIQELATAEN